MARKGPGKSDREGISLVREDVPDAAREWFESKADSPQCPHGCRYIFVKILFHIPVVFVGFRRQAAFRLSFAPPVPVATRRGPASP